jgi:hypothetical protein
LKEFFKMSIYYFEVTKLTNNTFKLLRKLSEKSKFPTPKSFLLARFNKNKYFPKHVHKKLFSNNKRMQIHSLNYIMHFQITCQEQIKLVKRSKQRWIA